MRYDRQIPLIGEDAQRKIGESRIGIAGCGGAGIAALTSLVEAGVIDFVLCDPSVPQIEDLNRQFIYAAGDLRPKSVICAEWALMLNYSAMAVARSEPVSQETVGMFEGCSVVLDCTGDPDAGAVLAEWCSGSGTPLVVVRSSVFEAAVAVVLPGNDVPPCPAPGVPKIGAASMNAGSRAAIQVLRLIADP